MSRPRLALTLVAVLLAAGAAQAQVYELFDPVAVHHYEPGLGAPLSAVKFLDEDDDGEFDINEALSWPVAPDVRLTLTAEQRIKLRQLDEAFNEVPLDVGSSPDGDLIIDMDGSGSITPDDRGLLLEDAFQALIRNGDPRIGQSLGPAQGDARIDLVVSGGPVDSMAAYAHDGTATHVKPGAWRLAGPLHGSDDLDQTLADELDRLSGRLIKVGDFDFGRGLSGPLPVDESDAFGYVDGNGNGIFDTGETGILDADGDGIASPFDLTLTPSLRKGAFEQLGIFDPEHGVELRFRHPGESKLAYYDNDGDNGWSSDDHFYIDMDASGSVSAGDIRFANNEMGVLAAGTRVASGDPDESRPLIRVPVGTTSLAFSDNDAQADYNGGDNLYWLQGFGVHGARQEDIRVGPFAAGAEPRDEGPPPGFYDVAVREGDDDTATPSTTPRPDARLGFSGNTLVLDVNGNGRADAGEPFYDTGTAGSALGNDHPITCSPVRITDTRIRAGEVYVDDGSRVAEVTPRGVEFLDTRPDGWANIQDVRLGGSTSSGWTAQRFDEGPSVGDVDLGAGYDGGDDIEDDGGDAGFDDGGDCEEDDDTSVPFAPVGLVAVGLAVVAFVRRRS
ncbi:MAG: hypothetical protein ACPGQL_02480 [Thermoplasmatota archaeon]